MHGFATSEQKKLTALASYLLGRLNTSNLFYCVCLGAIVLAVAFI